MSWQEVLTPARFVLPEGKSEPRRMKRPRTVHGMAQQVARHKAHVGARGRGSGTLLWLDPVKPKDELIKLKQQQFRKDNQRKDLTEQQKKENVAVIKLSSPRREGRFGGLLQDPFDSYPIPDQPNDVSRVLDYCFRIFSPIMWPSHALMQIPSPYVTHIFPLVLQHPETFAAQIALISCWTDLQRPKHALKRAMNNVLYYRAIAISRLRSKLMKPGAYADDATILATMYLLSVDLSLQQFDAMRAHHTGLQKMVASRGGLDALGIDGFLANQLRMCDFSHTREHGMSPLFPPKALATKTPTYPDHPFDPTLSLAIAPLPEALRELAVQRIISTDLLKMVAQIHRYVSVLRKGLARSAVSTKDRNFVGSFSVVDMIDDIFCVQTNLDRCVTEDDVEERKRPINSAGAVNLERYLCRALVLFLWDIYKSILSQTSPPYGKARDELGKALLAGTLHTELVPLAMVRDLAAKKSAARLRDAQHHILIWFSLVVASAWRLSLQPPVLLPPGQQLLVALVKQEPRAQAWSYVERILKDSCLWWPPSGEEWKACHELALKSLSLA